MDESIPYQSLGLVNTSEIFQKAMTAMTRQVFAEKPHEFDPRKYLGPARDALIEMVKHKNINFLGSASQVKGRQRL